MFFHRLLLGHGSVAHNPSLSRYVEALVRRLYFLIKGTSKQAFYPLKVVTEYNMIRGLVMDNPRITGVCGINLFPVNGKRIRDM